MQTVAVKLNGLDVAHGFALLSPHGKLECFHELFNVDPNEMAVAFETIAAEASGYSDDAQATVDIIRNAFNTALILTRKTERQAF